jgi:mRNA deadenylase 3'-5' endonuclease subunit Ccr4
MRLILILLLCNFTAMADERVKVISYNILASQYIKKEYYPGSNLEFLNNDIYRKELLTKYITSFNPDIICIQEYEKPYIEDALTKKGYKSFVYPKNQVGLAIFYNNKIDVIDNSLINLGNNKFALKTIFKIADKVFNIINIKIKWVPENLQQTKYLGYFQIERLLENQKSKNTIICGDFNTTNSGIIYQLFSNKQYKDIFALEAYNTVKANGKANRIDFCFTTSDATFRTTAIKGLSDTDIVPSELIPSDHLPLVFTFF